MSASYAAVLIKADAVRDNLEPLLLREIEEKGDVQIVFRRYWQLRESDICALYPTWVNKEVFPYMVKNLVQGPSLLCLAKGNKIHQHLTSVKGKMDRGGIRLRYRTHSKEEWEATGLSEDAVKQRMAENRIHTTDNEEETALMLSLCLTPQEVNLLSSEPRIYDLIRKHRALVPIDSRPN